MHLNAWYCPVNIHCSIVSLRFCANVGSEKQKTRQNGRNLDPVNHRCERLVVKPKHLSRKDPNDNCALQAGIALHLICCTLSFGSGFWFANCHLNEVSQQRWKQRRKQRRHLANCQFPIEQLAIQVLGFSLFVSHYSCCPFHHLQIFELCIRWEYLTFVEQAGLARDKQTI